MILYWLQVGRNRLDVTFVHREGRLLFYEYRLVAAGIYEY